MSFAVLVAASAASLLAFAIGARTALAQDRAAAETTAADALYERVADSTTTDAVPASPTPTVTPSPSDAPGSATASSPAAALSPAAAASPVPAAVGTPAASRTETVVVPDSMPAPSFAAQDAADQSTTEVPPAQPGDESQGAGNGPPRQNSNDNSEIVNYQKWQNDPGFDPRLHSLQEFMSEGSNSSPLGIEVRQAQAKLASGHIAEGLLIVDVTQNSPAARAGLHPFRRTVSDVLKGVMVAGALFFPPAVILVPVMDQVHIGESSDLIIAVDGARVVDYMQFADRMRDVRPGEIVYLSVVRDGARLQVPVKLPATLPPPVF
ncbi:MAG TPA: PDZ domain-containing protein [Candidatus Binataceae bacterium]|nr:PDZ domain-containing protein [Candidatus Binataceae bacterium]